jgi:hypothetical protein
MSLVKKKERKWYCQLPHIPAITVAMIITAHPSPPTPDITTRPDAPCNVIGDTVVGPVLVNPEAELIIAGEVVEVSCDTVGAMLPEVVDPLD